MPTGVQTISNVTPAKLSTVVNGFKAQGATVVTTKQTDGNYTVVATFPSQPAGN
jgi:hypothetical protein